MLLPRSFAAFLLLLLPLGLRAQIRFEKGYFIDSQNLRTECEIRNVDWDDSPVSFRYRLPASDEAEISGLLHDIQYLGAATRYELQLDNGQNFAVSQANNQWGVGDAPCQPGQRVTARWARAAMVALREEA